MEIAIPLYDRFTALDCIGPYEVLSRMPGARVRFLAKDAGPVRTDTGMLTVVAEASLAEVPRPDIVLVPGGPGDENAIADGALTAWLARAHETTKWTMSVCTGSVILAAAGILKGLEATTHWANVERLERYGARYTEKRVVRQGKIITGAGVSAGIDMGLTLLAAESGDEFAKAVQLGIEYDPQPPFDCGAPSKAPAHLVEMLRAISNTNRAAAS